MPERRDGQTTLALHEHDAEDGIGWLRSFSGLVNTCGLDHTMGPEEEDAAHFNYPYRRRIRHGLHGRIAYTPARLLGYGVRWEGERCLLFTEVRCARPRCMASSWSCTVASRPRSGAIP